MDEKEEKDENHEEAPLLQQPNKSQIEIAVASAPTQPQRRSNESEMEEDWHGWKEEDASSWDYWIAWFWVIKWFAVRLFFVFLLLVGGTYSRATLTLLFLEIIFAAYYGVKKEYFPGSVYNEMHTLIYRKKFDYMYGKKSFSAWFRFVLSLWGYFICVATAVTASTFSTVDPNGWFQTIYFIILLLTILLSLKQLYLYASIILLFYIEIIWVIFSFPFRVYGIIFCFCFPSESVADVLVPLLFRDVTADSNSCLFSYYSFVFANL